MRYFSVVAIVAAVALSASAFYVPGVAPRDFADGEQVEIKVLPSCAVVLGQKYPSNSLLSLERQDDKQQAPQAALPLLFLALLSA